MYTLSCKKAVYCQVLEVFVTIQDILLMVSPKRRQSFENDLKFYSYNNVPFGRSVCPRTTLTYSVKGYLQILTVADTVNNISKSEAYEGEYF